MHILMITSRPPWPITNGDQNIVFNRVIRLIKKHKLSIIFLYEQDDQTMEFDHYRQYFEVFVPIKITRMASLLSVSYRLILNPLMPSQVAYYRFNSVQHKINEVIEKNDFDLINVYLIRLWPYVAKACIPVIVDTIDSMRLNLTSKLNTKMSLFKRLFFLRELFLISRLEKKLVTKNIKNLVVAERDAKQFGGKCEVVELGVDIDNFAPKTEVEKHKIIFSGNLSYYPNVIAVKWFVENCLHLILQIFPDVKLYLCGAFPSQSILNMRSEHIVVTGFVKDISQWLSSSEVSIAPMQSGSGMQNKILEAIACEVPVVATRYGLGSIKKDLFPSLIVASSPEDFVCAIISVFENKKSFRKNASLSRQSLIQNYSWDAHVSNLIEIYESLVNKK
jgi:glycosyltransferase involved in cell wall biosynthesis